MTGAQAVIEVVAAQKRGEPRALTSICSAHPTVLRAAIGRAAADGGTVLIESTANQVNQFGGYTGWDPAAFRLGVASIAAEMGLPMDRIILGGDHLGPYPWRCEPADVAMRKATDLVSATVRAGYRKLHLDTSMSLPGDPADEHGHPGRGLVARRQAELASAAEAAWLSYSTERDDAAPVYVIGTEVPPPGGIPAGQGAVPVTDPKDLLETVAAAADAFRAAGLDGAWERTCAVVAQPGVEFGDLAVHAYDRPAAAALCSTARGLPRIALEAHSTDYQEPSALRQLVEDGVAILKVGPALTFALRECLFALEAIERELIACWRIADPSYLAATLERAMVDEPSFWRSHYAGSSPELAFARRFSYSDRARYYWFQPPVCAAVDRLLANLGRRPVPLPLLSQYLPLHYRAIREGRLARGPGDLVQHAVGLVLAEYAAATGG